MRVVIVGGSAAGAKVASKIRRLDQQAEITILQKGHDLIERFKSGQLHPAAAPNVASHSGMGGRGQ